MPLLNGTVILSLKLNDVDTGKFPKCTVYDPAGSTLIILTMTHLGLGLYQNLTYLMPNETFITAVFEVFDDAGQTIKSGAYQDASEIFELEQPGTVQQIVNVGREDITIDIEPDENETVQVEVEDDETTQVTIDLPDENEIIVVDQDVKEIDHEPDQEVEIRSDQ